MQTTETTAPFVFRWLPCVEGVGYLTIETDDGKRPAHYWVRAIPTQWRGILFRLEARGGQSDKSVESTDVFIADNGTGHSCQCWGFRRWRKPCKHILAMLDKCGEQQPGAATVAPF